MMFNSQYSYAHEKLGSAMDVFMCTSGRDKEKIKNIYCHYLSRLEKEDLPSNCVSKLSYIREKLTNSEEQEKSDPDNRYGTVHWAASTLHPRSVFKIKRLIWEMYKEVEDS